MPLWLATVSLPIRLIGHAWHGGTYANGIFFSQLIANVLGH